MPRKELIRAAGP